MFDNLHQKQSETKARSDYFRDFWLPSENNQYHPYSLKYRRLAFYASSAIAMKIIVALFVVLLPVTAWLTPDVLTAESKKVINLTNQIRTNLNLEPLTENAILDQAAYNKVEDMFLGQYFAHISPEGKRASTWLKALGYGYHVAGENLALGFSSAEDVVAAWENSPTHYANMIDPLYTEIGVSMANGLYSEVDTTLAAQYFGKPRTVLTSTETVTEKPKVENIVPEKKIAVTEVNVNSANKVSLVVPEDKVIPVNDLQNANIVPVKNTVASASVENDVNNSENTEVVNEVVDDEISVEQTIPEPLLPAVINAPVNHFVTNHTQMTLDIQAPQAERVVVYDNSIVLATKDKARSLENISVNVNLVAGNHEIYVQSIRGTDTAFSEKYFYQVDFTAPSVDLDKTKIIIDQPEGKNETLIKIDAYLSDDVVSATVAFGQKEIVLSENSAGHWLAYATFSDVESASILDPVILPNLTIIDQAGNQNIVDLSLDKVQPLKTSLLEQYFFLRKNQIAQSATLFNISIIYYKIFTLLLAIALALNIFVHIKRQNYKVIGSSVLFLSLLALLIIF